MKKIELPNYKKGEKIKVLRNKIGGGGEEIEVIFDSLVPQSDMFWALYKNHRFILKISKIITSIPETIQGTLDKISNRDTVKTKIIKKDEDKPKKKEIKKPVLTSKTPTKTERVISLLARGIDLLEIQKIVENRAIAHDFFFAFKDIHEGMSFKDSAKKNTGLSPENLEKKYVTYKTLKDGK